MSREVSVDEIIGVWLKREYNPENWQRFRNRLPDTITLEEMNRIVNSQDYTSQSDNTIRFLFLDYSRQPLFIDMLDAQWKETTFTEDEFKKLRIIADSGWRMISKYSGLLSGVANFLHGRFDLVLSFLQQRRRLSAPSQRRNWDVLIETVETIRNMEQSPICELDKTLFLLKSYDSIHTTILEGNKTAVALYIKYFILNQAEYESPQIFLGQLKKKSQWQW